MTARAKGFLGFCFLGMVLVVAWTAAPDFVAALRSYTWQATPCTIVRSQVAEEPFSPRVMHFVLRVEYTYAFLGREYRSTRFTTGAHQGSTEVTRAQRAAVRFAAGTKAVCYVNPRDPAEAVLERGRLWGGLMMLAPLLLLGLIAHESIFGWFERRRWNRRAVEQPPLSEANDAFGLDGRLLMFGSIGLLMGCFLLGCFVAYPVWGWQHSRQWVPTEAVITRCELATESSQHGPSYSLKLTYEYEVAGRLYRSDRRRFGGSLDEPVVDLVGWVAAHPPGSRVRCLVAPEDPTEAVLEPQVSVGWVTPFLGVLMLGMGVCMSGNLVWTRWLRWQLAGSRLSAYCLGKREAGRRALRLSQPPWLEAVLSALGIAGFGAAAGWSLNKGLRAVLLGRFDLINLLYGAAATGIVVWLVRRSGKALRQALQPCPRLHLTPGTPGIGERFEVQWEFPRARRMESLRIWLEAAEEAKVRHQHVGLHGSVSEERTQRMVLWTVPLLEAAAQQAAGSVSGQVPAEAMHSFRGEKCALVWRLKVRLTGPDGEPLEYSFPLSIRPGKR